MTLVPHIVHLMGRTPLVQLGPMASDVPATVLVKLEYLNPGGSVKDRIAVAMIDRAERDGLLRPGGTIVEPTSGNTGVGLVLVAQRRGYRCVFVCTDKVSRAKRNVLLAYGAEVVVCPATVPPEHPDSYHSVSDRLAASIAGAWKPDQYSNPDGPASHEATTGPEIWADTEGRVTTFVAGIGTGGTISGTGRYLKRMSDGRAGGPVRVVGAAPTGSVYCAGATTPYFVEGVGQDFFPAAFDPSVPDGIVAIDDDQAFATARRAARTEGLLIGGSSGLALRAALDVAADLSTDDVVVALLPDGGRGYLDTFYDDDWMRERGFDDVVEATSPALVTPGSAAAARP